MYNFVNYDLSFHKVTNNVNNIIDNNIEIINDEFAGIQLHGKCNSNMLSSSCIFYLQKVSLVNTTITIDSSANIVVPNLLIHYIKINNSIRLVMMSYINNIFDNGRKKIYIYKSNNTITFDTNITNTEIVAAEFPIEIVLMGGDNISNKTDIYSYEFINIPGVNISNGTLSSTEKKKTISICHVFLFAGLRKTVTI